MVTEPNGTQPEPLPEKGAPSVEGKEPSSDKVVETFLKEDVDKVTGDLKAVHGKEKKALERQVGSYEKELTDVRAQLAKIEEEADRKAYEAVKDDSSGLAVFKREQELKTREKDLRDEKAKLDKDKADHTDLLVASERASLLLTVSEIATEIGVDKDSILKFKPKTPEDAREIAQAVKDLGGGTTTSTKQPDPGTGTGAGMNFENMSAEQKILYAVEHPRRKTS